MYNGSGTNTKRDNAGRGYLYLLQEREFVRSGEDVFKVGRTDRDVFDRFKEYPKGSRLLWCKHVPIDRLARLEDEVKARFRSRFRARTDVGSESFAGPWTEMTDVANEVINDDLAKRSLAEDVVRRTGCRSAAEYDDAIARFLRDSERELQGRLVAFEEVDRMFQRFLGREGETVRATTLLKDPFLDACRAFGAAAHERLEVQFRAAGESSLLDAAMRLRAFAYTGGK